MEEASVASVHEPNDSQQREGAYEGRMVSTARIAGYEQSGLRGSSDQCMPRVQDALGAARSLSVRRATSPPRVGAGTRRETSLSNLRRHRGCTLGEMNYRGD